MSSVFSSFHVEVNDVIEGVDEEGKVRIVMYVSARGETGVGIYNNEYVWSMGFEHGDRGRIERWSEFVDVGVARDFYPRLRGEIERRAVEAGKA